MIRNVCTALLVVCCLAVPAVATVTVTAGSHILFPNTPGNVVPILISSSVPQGIQSADLGLEVVDINGAISQGTPLITAVDMTSPGTVFGDAPGGNTGQSDFELYPTANQLSSIATTSGDTVPAAGGVLAFVTIDTTGLLQTEIFAFNLIYAPFFLSTSTSSIPAQSTVLSHGEFTHVPEPGSIVLGLFAAAGLAAVAIRRRRCQRRCP